MKKTQFKSKTKLKNYLKYCLNNVLTFDEKIDKNHEMFELLYDVIQDYYDTDWLIGDGIEYFFISKCNVNPRNKKFNVCRVDGTKSEFSYIKCITGKKNYHEDDVKTGFRVIVDDQIREFKEKWFIEKSDNKGYCICEESGLKFRIHEAHVDHTPPYTFDSLIYAFLERNNLKFEDIPVDTNGEKDSRTVITDKKIVKNFYKWHLKNARLRCIFWKSNLQQKRTKNFNNEDVILYD